MTLIPHFADHAAGRIRAKLGRGGSQHTTVNVLDSGKDSVTFTITVPRKAFSLKGGAQIPAHQQVKLKHQVERLVEGLVTSDRPTTKFAQLVRRVEQVQAPERVEAVRTKKPQNTIGVNSCAKFRDELSRQAQEGGVKLAELARERFEQGLELLEERLWHESSKTVFRELEELYSRFDEGETAQWSLRISREPYVRALLIAKQYEISQSRLACVCLAAAIERFAVA